MMLARHAAHAPSNVETLLGLFSAPATASELSAADWNVLLPVARRLGGLARLHACLEDAGQLASVPPRVVRHLYAARELTNARTRALRWELRCLTQAVAEPAPIALKGMAYQLLGLAAGRGRLSSDLDVLYPYSAMTAVETTLFASGWVHQALKPYDDRYYRQWMHELPAFVHPLRGMTVDVHHAILPRTARLHPDSARLIAAAHTLDTADGVRVLCPHDLLLHAAAHACYDGAFEHPLRDLLDIHQLCMELGDSAFWRELPARALELDLGRPLWYALSLARQALGTPVPDAVFTNLRPAAPSALSAWLLLRLVSSVLLERPGAHPARWCLFIRSHWLRMPPWMLLPHLVRKTWRRLRARSS
ncbi:putative nucleotidyltransferase-like protein [Plasticicumulans acidivorans]|uniref:Putative nucleotidyltransferase-like protein n=1 Tax=Plasticicumulans acidivorans TaxID=886464 RepID=A0A317MRN3_9GAMM|nr:putative nucleotidyltransferase-like protein [Plasticicumulans acidivorans]